MNFMNDSDTELSWKRKSQKRKMRMTVTNVQTLASILYQQRMGKTRPKKLRKVKKSKKKFHHLLGRKEQTQIKEKSAH